MSTRRKGFTLIELSIVLMILFLIVGGIVGGKNLIESAKVYALIREVNFYLSNIKKFEATYDALPGDMSNATDYWPSSDDGDGNGVYVEGTQDIALIWEHLKNADMIQGSYSGELVSGTYGQVYERVGITSPRSKVFSYAGYGVATIPSVWMSSGEYYPAMTDDRNYLIYGADGITTPSSAPKSHRLFNAAITSKMAYRIDSKLDDGKPGQGAVLTYRPKVFFCNKMCYV